MTSSFKKDQFNEFSDTIKKKLCTYLHTCGDTDSNNEIQRHGKDAETGNH